MSQKATGVGYRIYSGYIRTDRRGLGESDRGGQAGVQVGDLQDIIFKIAFITREIRASDSKWAYMERGGRVL